MQAGVDLRNKEAASSTLLGDSVPGQHITPGVTLLFSCGDQLEGLGVEFLAWRGSVQSGHAVAMSETLVGATDPCGFRV